MAAHKKVVKLTPSISKFIDLYLANPTNAGQAYIDAGHNIKLNSARVMACTALKSPEVVAEIKKRQAKMQEEAHISRMEIVGFLADTIRTPIGKLDENHRLTQEHTVDEVGEMTMKTKIKMPSKLEAIKILNAMMGWNAPEEVNHKHEIAVVIGGDAE
jgi:phage terminase small subunit